MTYIYHVTLNTGHGARQYRRDVGEAAIAALSDTLDGVLQGAHLPVPGQPDYLLNGRHSGHDLIATVWRVPWDKRAPILTCGTALKSRSASALWRMLHERPSLPLVTDPTRPPSAPWQADRIEAGALLDASPMTWTGDFSRCLAWAWHDYREGRP